MRKTAGLRLLAAMTLAATATGLHAKRAPEPSPLTRLPDEGEPSVTMPGGAGRASALSGRPLALYAVNHAVTAAEPEAMARQYLRETAPALGFPAEAIGDLRLRAVGRLDALTTVRLDQTYRGVPVYGAEVTVTLDPKPQVVFVMNGFRPGLQLESVEPRLTAREARAAGLGYLGVDGPLAFEQVSLVVHAGRTGARLAWRVRLEPSTAPLGDWDLLVDAASGEVFRAEDRAAYSPVNGTGNVFDPDPLSSAHATYGATGFTDNLDADSAQLTAQLMSRTLLQIDLTAGIHTLKGPWAEIVDFEAPFKGLFTQASSAFTFTRNPDNFEAANTYYHIDTIMRWINTTLGLSVHPYQYPGGVKFDPSGFNGADNSHYLSGSGQLSFGEGGVDDDEDADVIVHELGHGLHDWVTSGGLSQVQGLSEGSGDYMAMSYSRSFNQWLPADPQYQWVFSWDGHNEWWSGRVTNWPNHYPDQLTGQIHTDGQIWATALMRIWNRIGRLKTDKAFLVGLGMTNGASSQQDAAQAVIQASLTLGYTPDEQYAIFQEFQITGYVVTPVPVGLQGFSVE